MNSAIYLELSEATGLSIKRGQDHQAFFVDLIKAVANLKDPEWDKLSAEAQEWYNAAAEAKNKKKEIEAFPDLQADEEKEEPRRSNRRRSDDENEAKPMLKVGDEVTVKTKKGTERKGTIVEQDDKLIVIKDGADEYEYKRENIESITAKHGAADADDEKPRRRRSEEPDEPAVPELKVGDKVKAVTKRGKTIEGTIDAINDETVSIDDGKEIWDFDKDRLESLTPIGAVKEEPSEGRRSTRGGKAAEEPAADAKRTRVSNEKGVSVGQRIRELIADDFDISEDAVAKVLKKEGIDCKENTLSLNYKEAMKFIEILKAKKRLK